MRVASEGENITASLNVSIQNSTMKIKSTNFQQRQSQIKLIITIPKVNSMAYEYAYERDKGDHFMYNVPDFLKHALVIPLWSI